MTEPGPTEWGEAPGVGPRTGPLPDDPRYDPELLRTGDRRNVVDAYRYWTREAIIADYVATAERMDRVLASLRASDTYRADLDSRPADAHLPRPEYMAGFLRYLDDRFGGPLGWLARHGWREHDHRALRARLLD